MLKKHYKPFNKPVSIHNPTQQPRWLDWISPVPSVVISSKVKIYCTEAMQSPVQMEQGLCPPRINSVQKEPQISKHWNISKTAWDKQVRVHMHVSKRKTTKTVHSSFQHRVFLYVPSCTSYTCSRCVWVCINGLVMVMVNTHMTHDTGFRVTCSDCVHKHVLHVL